MGSSTGGSETHGTSPKSILAWYDGARPMWIDLVGDYAGKELFLIEGDSLLRECFEDERIDFKGNVACLSASTNRLLVCCYGGSICSSLVPKERTRMHSTCAILYVCSSCARGRYLFLYIHSFDIFILQFFTIDN
jgi:hypothetical protein